MNRLATVSLRVGSIVRAAAASAAGGLLMLSPLPISAGEDTARPRLAWVVGNAAYSGMAALHNPVHDAQDMCAALQRLRFRTLCQTDVPDRASLLEGFARFTSQLTPDTQGLVYYAGHAVQIEGHNYLVPTHALLKKLGDVPAELVDVQELLEQLRHKGNAFNVIALDACRDDPFANTAAAKPNPAPNLLRGVGPLMGETTGPLHYGLAAIRDAPAGSIVLYATGANGVALDGKGRNGLLTKHLLAHIETPGLTVEDMIKRVGAGVQAESGAMGRRPQTPFVYSSFTGEFCFADCKAHSENTELNQLKAQNLRLEQQLRQAAPAGGTPPRNDRPVMPATF